MKRFKNRSFNLLCRFQRLSRAAAMKRCKKHKPKLPELPDCVMSHIFSMLTLKDSVKTSALSKQWIHEWGLRIDLNFDLHNMFDYKTIQDLPKSLPLSQNFDFQYEFADRLDQFVLHYQGASIRSIRVNFPLDNGHSDAIDRLISKGISKGVKRIELLFSSEINDTTIDIISQTVPYRFSTTLLSDTDSLTYLHLQNCLLITPMDFSGLKNLTTIVLDGVIDSPSQHILSHLFSESLQLEDATFMNCQFKRTMIITSPKLRHLNMINCGSVDFITSYLINALNLLSFEYSNHRLSLITVNAPRLLKVFLNTAVRAKTPYPFYRIRGLTHIQSLAMIICPSQIDKLTEKLAQFQNLRQLDLFIDGAYDFNMDCFWILDIAIVSQHLQKLSLTIRNLHLEHSHIVGFKSQKRKHAGFSHNDLKYVEFCGCVCSTNVIDLASHLLRNAKSLKKMIFSSRDKFYIGASRWTNSSNKCCGFEHNVIHEILKEEVNEQCQLIIL